MTVPIAASHCRPYCFLLVLSLLFGCAVTSSFAECRCESSDEPCSAGAQETRPIKGLVADGHTDNRAIFQRTFDLAKEQGFAVAIPKGRFAFSGTLSIDCAAVSGTGDETVLSGLDPHHQALVLTGTGSSLSAVRIIGNTSAGRLSEFEASTIYIRDAAKFTVRNVHVSGVGIGIDNSADGRIVNNSIESTVADSIHITNGSRKILVTGNRVYRSGDDGIAVVSYEGQPRVREILLQRNSVIANTWGRGLAVVGGDDIRLEDNYVKGGASDYAGIYIAAEAEWKTLGVDNVQAIANTLIDAGGIRSGHGAITIYNSQPGRTNIRGVVLEGNRILNPRSSGILVTGPGFKEVAIKNNTLYANRRELLANADAAAAVTTTDNRSLPASAYPGPIIEPGNGHGTTTSDRDLELPIGK
jgi:hypothetical protein